MISNLKINTKLLEETEMLLAALFPICRSITGNGVRKSLSILKNISNFQINEIKSETKCFDWKIPDEWNVDSAFLEDENGKFIHYQNYQKLSLTEQHTNLKIGDFVCHSNDFNYLILI